MMLDVPTADLAVSPLTPSTVAAAAAILEDALGAGYVTADDLAPYTDGGSHVALVATAAGSVTGAVTADLLNDADALLVHVPADMHAAVLAAVPELAGEDDVALLHSIAVMPQARGRGIARRLVADMTDLLVDSGARLIVSVGWTDHDGCHIAGPLTASGFHARGAIAGYWTEDSIAKGYACPTCGPACRCVARVFARGWAPLCPTHGPW